MFVNEGFSNWKTALESKKGFQLHAESGIHRSSIVAWNEQINRAGTEKSISNLISAEVLELRRYYISSIINIIRFLIENELSVRGNWNKDTESEDGVFMNLFKYTIEIDAKFEEKSSSNAKARQIYLA